jgi:hypothetical protein
MTFLEAASASPEFTATIIGLSIAPFLIVFLVQWIRYRPYRAALKLSPDDVHFWTVSYMSDVTDEAGIVMFRERETSLCMQVKGKPVFTVNRGRLDGFIAEIQAHGFEVETFT